MEPEEISTSRKMLNKAKSFGTMYHLQWRLPYPETVGPSMTFPNSRFKFEQYHLLVFDIRYLRKQTDLRVINNPRCVMTYNRYHNSIEPLPYDGHFSLMPLMTFRTH